MGSGHDRRQNRRCRRRRRRSSFIVVICSGSNLFEDNSRFLSSRSEHCPVAVR